MTSRRILIKIGTKVITKENGELDERIFKNIVDQVVALKRQGDQVLVVTSGAVASGRSLIEQHDTKGSILQKQVFAAIGQVKLMTTYSHLLSAHSLLCAQVLVTKEDFRDSVHYFNMKNCLEDLLQENIVPIINENDVIAVSELIFTDNDELAGLTASMINADYVVILTSVDGVLDEKGNVIREIDPDSSGSVRSVVRDEKTSVGRGGMQTKFNIAKKLACEGIHAYIVPGKHANVILDVLDGAHCGTHFIATRKSSGRKRRIAHSEGLSKGIAYINVCAQNIILDRTKTVSLLPVGIVKIEGEFSKGDIIEIHNEAGEKLGFGVVQYDDKKAREVLGKKNCKALIHYDYMFIEGA